MRSVRFTARTIRTAVLAASLTLAESAATAEDTALRKWTDSTGKISVQAVFVEFKDGRVHLKKANDETVAVPVERLSKADQRLVRELLAARRTARKPEEPSNAKTAAAGDWLAWRGPTANGIAAEGPAPPVEWSDTKNVIWKTPVPGRGHASPIVVGPQVVLATAEESAQVQAIVSFDRKTGSPRWKTDVNQGSFAVRIHNKNTHASPTLACNGEQIFAAFNNNDGVQLVALTLEGKVQWQKFVGFYRPQKYKFGYAPSPLIYKSTVIVASEFETEGFLAAFDQKTGREVWRTPRPKRNSFSSPIVGRVAGRDQLLISGCDLVASYDPATGKPLWSCPGTTNATCGTMVWDGDLVFASGGYPEKQTIAVRADGSAEVAWQNREKCYEQSMLAYDGHLYAVNDAGIAFCWDAESGEEKWQERLSGPVSVSPILAGGNIYASDERGTTYVFRANPDEFHLVAKNRLGSESFATPAIVAGQVFTRVADGSSGSRQEMLYCLGKKGD